jgi:hypothetical protein
MKASLHQRANRQHLAGQKEVALIYLDDLLTDHYFAIAMALIQVLDRLLQTTPLEF